MLITRKYNNMGNKRIIIIIRIIIKIHNNHNNNKNSNPYVSKLSVGQYFNFNFTKKCQIKLFSIDKRNLLLQFTSTFSNKTLLLECILTDLQ